MPVELKSLRDLRSLQFDDIIDVRSPSEFAEDHIPGAVNLPVLSDDERALVGTIYVQDSPFKARKIGAALVAKNAAKHLEQSLIDKPGDWRPLIYCWRGGQRSASFTSILSQIGWRADTLSGGYKSYRRLVVELLYKAPLERRIVLLDGYTGTAKTELLGHLSQLGTDILDLEGLACHRGSVLGETCETQPTQCTFESNIALEMTAVDGDTPLVLEAESSKIGNRLIPPSLWKAMKIAPRIRISAPVDARAKFLARAYQDLAADVTRLHALIARLSALHSSETIKAWKTLAAEGRPVELAQSLITEHYDPRYRRQSRNVSVEIELSDLEPPSLAQVAVEIKTAISQV